MKKEYTNEIKVGSIVRIDNVREEFADTYSKYVNKLGRVVKINVNDFTKSHELEIKLLNDKSDHAWTYSIRPSMAEIDHVLS